MADSEADNAIAALNGRTVDGQVITVGKTRPKLYRSEPSPEPPSAGA